jgi:heptosyltransferase-1
LEHFVQKEYTVHVVTRPEWIPALQELTPQFVYNDTPNDDTINLDQITDTIKPSCHKTQEFAQILGVNAPLSQYKLKVPPSWKKLAKEFEDAVGFAPEAGHEARQWPFDYVSEFAKKIKGIPSILIGTENAMALPADLDLRGTLDLKNLVAVLSQVKTLVCMDSGILHIANALDLPTIAIFSGIDPQYRVLPTNRVLALQAELECSPCNKNETCNGEYPCLHKIRPEFVFEKLKSLSDLKKRIITKV